MTQFNATSYHVERSTGQCAATGRILEPDETYMATLVEVNPQKPADPSLKRIDVSLASWEEGFRPPRLFCHWRAVVQPPKARKRMFVDDSVLYNLFLRLADDPLPQRQAFRFVLALILMRKKLLRYDGTTSRGEGASKTSLWRVTPKLDLSKGPLGKWDESQPMEVLDPKLEDSQIQEVTDQLTQVLESEL